MGAADRSLAGRRGAGVTAPVTLAAPAKLTLSLRITGVRADGYHLIDAEMVSLAWADTLTITPGGNGLSADGPFAAGMPLDDTNLVARALRLAGRMIEWSPGVRGGQGLEIAREILSSGRALTRMNAIIAAQGATDFDYRQPALGTHAFDVRATTAGVVTGINNLRLARIAGLAGAPKVKTAGVDLVCRLGQAVAPGDVLYRVYAAYPADAAFAHQASDAASGYTIGAPADVPRVLTEF